VITSEIVDDDAHLARRAAEFVAGRARAAVADHGTFFFAVSGGRTPWAMFAELAHEDVPWDAVAIYQVDERVAPEGDPDRNLTHLRAALTGVAVKATVHAMPVNEPNLTAAAADYAATLPDHFDLIHLGLGPDGHTASLVPGDAVLELDHSDVGVTQPYMGHRRMTLTLRALDRAREIVWLIAGADKAVQLTRLYAHDTAIPAGRVAALEQIVFADKAAAGL
jgi:6-phosphogluconolactonase